MEGELFRCSPTEEAWRHTSVDVSEGPPLLMELCEVQRPELWLCDAGVAEAILLLPGSCIGAGTRG